MKRQTSHQFTRLPGSIQLTLQQLPYLCALVVAGALSAGTGLLWLPHAALAETAPAAMVAKENKPAGTGKAQLPAMTNRLRQDLSRRVGIPVNKLRVVEATQKTWSNGCLGLATSNEFCTEALVSGWRVVLSDGYQRWVYRTDRQGGMYRLESSVKRSSLPAKPAKAVEGGGQEQADAVKPTSIARAELPAALESQAVFRSISSGGFIGRTYQTTLLRDGRVLRVLVSPNGTNSTVEVRRLTQPQIQQFLQVLKQQSMKQFDRLNYAATPGSADFITVTLSSRSGTVRYADSIQNQLPRSLKTIIQAWSEISRAS